VKCLTSDLLVPAGAELVIEGEIDPGATAYDGAFGNHTGYYHPSSLASLVRVTAITRRHDMIYPTTVVGPPPMEDCWLATAAGRLFLALLRIDVPEVTGLHQPLSGIFHGGTVVAVRNGSGRGKGIIAAIRKTPWFSRSRMIVLVDDEQAPSNLTGVYWRVMNNVEWERDLVINDGCLLLDATAKISEGEPRRVPVTMDEQMVMQVKERWREYGFTND
jgi:4-hydroxy-3-polyprenylbenzoate decarboxylase